MNRCMFLYMCVLRCVCCFDQYVIFIRARLNVCVFERYIGTTKCSSSPSYMYVYIRLCVSVHIRVPRSM